ncbi:MULTISPECIES: DUF1254 domain-containing protein [Alphaproteobacteria]|uniref:Membrane protein n=2 Tax=Alphaproteobacteria TaxID=28211 RepID=A0A512HFX9_9HYPH|nr:MULTISPECIES: DUF1254 domain-containing protein [Alphaproteobacteria]GEO84341.1 membrane protein [Ciceribacter naphthalenivorans]GLR24878.1 membrane protein [Ciceribacter naphthalenivorans]GLT07734.1 membrane protein [Sphingomonas psychrolutea]
MNRFLYAVLTGLIGAAILHIVIILSLPNFTGKDAFTRVKAMGPAHRFISLPDKADAAGLSNVDPFLKVAVCHFDLSHAPLRLLAAAGPSFWSMVVYDKDSNEVFSMNDRTSVTGDLDALVATPVQVAQIRKAPGAALTQSIIIEHRGATGYVVLRTLVPARSLEKQARSFLEEALCAPLLSEP